MEEIHIFMFLCKLNWIGLVSNELRFYCAKLLKKKLAPDLTYRPMTTEYEIEIDMEVGCCICCYLSESKCFLNLELFYFVFIVYLKWYVTFGTFPYLRTLRISGCLRNFILIEKPNTIYHVNVKMTYYMIIIVMQPNAEKELHRNFEN